MSTNDPSAGVTLTRRELFAGAGAAAGALAALGGLGATLAPAAQAAVRSRQYFASFVNLELDGQFAGRLLSATGGEALIVPAGFDEATRTLKGPSLRYEPLALVFGDMSAAVFDWVGKASTNSASPRTAAVVAYDAAGKEVYRLAMQNVRLSEMLFDSLDAGRAEVLRVSAKLQPGQSTHDLSARTTYKGEVFKQTPLLRSNFRLLVQGVESATTRARSVDQVGLLARQDGLLAPSSLRFTVPLAYAAPLFGWMNDTLAGKSGPRPAELQLLTRDLSRVSASVTFEQLQILRISCPLDARGDRTLQEVEVECLPAATVFKMGDLLA